MGVEGFDDEDEGLFVNGRAVLDGEPEEELNELATKCFDSDPDMNVPLKN